MKKNIFKKIIALTYLTFLLFGFLTPVRFSLAFTCEKAPICKAPSVLSTDGCSCTYVLSAPLPDSNGGVMNNFDPSQNNNIGVYLNLMIKLFIGICAVLAVIMIVMGGIEYMTSELPGLKSDGKGKITNAILGLILALGAWTLLNTINPNILNTDLSSLAEVTVTVPISNFQIFGSGALSKDGAPINIDFNTQAYPAASAAAAKTGVDPALILAIFAQETGGGANTGACTPGDAKAKMTTEDITALAYIVGPDKVATTRVSCSLSEGHGGAIGLTQFMPTTWMQYKDTAAGYLGHEPDPWDTEDALMMTAVYLQAKGGATDPTAAAKAYFGACNSGGVDYCNQVAAKTASLKIQIDKAKKDGKIS